MGQKPSRSSGPLQLPTGTPRPRESHKAARLMTATSGRARGSVGQPHGSESPRASPRGRRSHHAGNFPAGAGRGGTGVCVSPGPRPPRRTPTCTERPSPRPGPARSPGPPRAAAAAAGAVAEAAAEAGARRAARRAQVPAERPASRVAWGSRRLARSRPSLGHGRAARAGAKLQREPESESPSLGVGRAGGGCSEEALGGCPGPSRERRRPAPAPPPVHVTSLFR